MCYWNHHLLFNFEICWYSAKLLIMVVIYWVSLADHSKRCPKRGVCLSSCRFFPNIYIYIYICTVYTYAINIRRLNTSGTFFGPYLCTMLWSIIFSNGSIYTNDKDEQACPILPVCTLSIEFLCFFSLIVHILKVTVTMRCVFPPL